MRGPRYMFANNSRTMYDIRYGINMALRDYTKHGLRENVFRYASLLIIPPLDPVPRGLPGAPPKHVSSHPERFSVWSEDLFRDSLETHSIPFNRLSLLIAKR